MRAIRTSSCKTRGCRRTEFAYLKLVPSTTRSWGSIETKISSYPDLVDRIGGRFNKFHFGFCRYNLADPIGTLQTFSMRPSARFWIGISADSHAAEGAVSSREAASARESWTVAKFTKTQLTVWLDYAAFVGSRDRWKYLAEAVVVLC